MTKKGTMNNHVQGPAASVLRIVVAVTILQEPACWPLSGGDVWAVKHVILMWMVSHPPPRLLRERRELRLSPGRDDRLLGLGKSS